MIPPPKPLWLVMVAWVTANVPLVASMLALVGSGPRWNGLPAAVACGLTAVTRPSARVSPAAARAVVLMMFSGCTSSYSLLIHTGHGRLEFFGGRVTLRIGVITGVPAVPSPGGGSWTRAW